MNEAHFKCPCGRSFTISRTQLKKMLRGESIDLKDLPEFKQA